MSVNQQSADCPTCRRQRLVVREQPNHVLHLLLSVVTLGLWLIVWFWLATTNRPWRCTVCGTAFRPTASM